MSTEQLTSPQQTSAPAVRFGVGIDTSRFGHYAAFLTDDQQQAAAELSFAESFAGYQQFRQRLEHIAQRHPRVSFLIRLDAAGQYADNLLHFLEKLRGSSEQHSCVIGNATILVSCGDPQRNKNYRAALFGSKKSDPVEARACAHFAVSQRIKPAPLLSLPLRTLRQIASRLHAAARQRTRAINQLHHLLALAFPELAVLVEDVSHGWVLELVHRYPTAELLAAASAADLAAIPYLPDGQIAGLLKQARCSIASLAGSAMAQLVRDQVRQLRDAIARVKRLEGLLVAAYRALPTANHLDTIPGIGAVSAAVLTAFILDIDRFETPGKLVAYFGVLPIEVSSGVERDGQPRASRRYVMSKRGNDLVRRYLWMNALCAVQCNPAVRALFRWVAAKNPEHKAIAIGHAMRKLLHLVFALWKSGKPFDPTHYPWEAATPAASQPAAVAPGTSRKRKAGKKQAAGHKPEIEPAQEVVTAACAPTVATDSADQEGMFIDFAHLKKQLPVIRVLEHLGLSARLRGSGPQRRCACPIHRGDGRGTTFSVHLEDNVFRCFDSSCGKHGDVIDLWSALHHLDLRAAAIDLVSTFALEPAPRSGTEKRHG
jgi:transposase